MYAGGVNILSSFWPTGALLRTTTEADRYHVDGVHVSPPNISNLVSEPLLVPCYRDTVGGGLRIHPENARKSGRKG